MLQFNNTLEMLGDDVHRRLKRSDDDFIATTNEYFLATGMLWIFKRALKIAGFVENAGVWRPLTGDAVVRLFSGNSMKSGRNVLSKIEGSKKSDLVESTPCTRGLDCQERALL